MLMSRLGKLLETSTGRIIISIILGLGLAMLFRKVCDDYNCIAFKGTSNDDVKDKVFRYNEKCYKYNITPITCNKDKKIVHF
jgi:hypothetical protein